MLVGAGGKVYCIEAHPRTYRFLRNNVALNKFTNMDLLNLALGDKDSEIRFSDMRDDDQNRVSQNGSGIPVKMMRLDDVSIAEHSVELLKIDVEGYEKFVLEGARRTLERVDCIYFESYEAHFNKYKYSCGDVISLLENSGFRLFRLSASDAIVPVDSSYSSSYCENLIAVRNLEAFQERTGFRIAA